jgi:hypothetical protein
MQSTQRLWCGDSGGNDERKKKAKGVVNAAPLRSIYKGPAESANCGSFHGKELTPTSRCRKFRESISPDFAPTDTNSMDILSDLYPEFRS